MTSTFVACFLAIITARFIYATIELIVASLKKQPPEPPAPTPASEPLPAALLEFIRQSAVQNHPPYTFGFDVTGGAYSRGQHDKLFDVIAQIYKIENELGRNVCIRGILVQIDSIPEEEFIRGMETKDGAQ